jgi:cell division septal protein FtsQ
MKHYRKSHIKNKINKIKPKKPIFLCLWFWLSILFFIILCGFIYLLFFFQGLQINNIEISGNEKVKTEELKSLATTGINRKIIDFGLIKIFSKNILVVDTGSLKKEILNKFPIIEKITISRKFPQTITMGVVERKPVGVFCDNSEKCFLVDQNGIAFEGLEAVPQGMFIVRQELEEKDAYTGEEVIAQNIITAISKIQKNLNDNYQIDVKEALVSTPTRLNILTGESWQIYFGIDQDSDMGMQLQKLNALLNSDITPEIRKVLEYIDLRFKDRAYYK